MNTNQQALPGLADDRASSGPARSEPRCSCASFASSVRTRYQSPADTEHVCGFGAWARAVARDLSAELAQPSLAEDADEAVSVVFLLRPDALKPPNEATSLPACYAYDRQPITVGVRLLGTLYSHAHDPGGKRGLAHRIGFDHAPKTSIVDRFFALGIDEAAFAYRAEGLDMHDFGCRTPEDLRALYGRVLSASLGMPMRFQE